MMKLQQHFVSNADKLNVTCFREENLFKFCVEGKYPVGQH